MKRIYKTMLLLAVGIIPAAYGQEINLSWANVSNTTNSFSFDIVMSPGTGYSSSTVANGGNFRFDVSTGDTPPITSVSATNIHSGYTASGQTSVPGTPPPGSREYGVSWTQPGGQPTDLLLNPGTPFTLTHITVTFSGPINASALFSLRPFTGVSGQSFWSYGGGINVGYNAPPPTPLPVTLISFNAQKESTTANLTWSTTEETNSDRFEIQHSLNAKNWTMIGTVASHGESVVKRDYSYTHTTPSAGSNYYRLKMVDKDATFAYSSIRSLDFDGFSTSNNFKAEVFPNPVSETLTIDVKDWDSVKNVQLINQNGVPVYDSGKAPSAFVNVKGFQSGIYLVKIIKTDGSLSAHKIVILR